MGPADTVDERFLIEEEAASGGMGTVYRGRDRMSGARVAIKVLHRSGVTDQERFVREARLLAELAGPGIVRYVAHGILAAGSPYLVMDWVEGETLEARLRGDGVTIAESVTIARRVAAALARAHARGVVHRDLKPSNLIFPDGDLDRTTVIDFGVARAMSQAGSLTETGSVVGTPSYMAPEQVRGDRVIEPSADMFSLGCVLYECLTGRLAFEGARFLALRAKIMLWEPPRARTLAPEVPAALDELVARMLAKAPGDRPRDAAALAPLLDALGPLPDHASTRRARHSDLPTDFVRRPRPRPRSPETGQARTVSFVVAGLAEHLDPGAAPTITPDDLVPVRAALERALGPDAAGLELLDDGTVVARWSDDGPARELARRAATSALAIRRALPDALIGVATAEAHASEEADLIEDAVHGLARDAITLVFSGVGPSSLPAGVIRLDARTAALVDPELAVLKVQDGFYLRADQAG